MMEGRMMKLENMTCKIIYLCLALVMMALSGCGSSDTSTPAQSTGTKTTSEGTVAANTSGIVPASTGISAPLGNTLTFRQDTLLSTDVSGTNPVTGSIPTRVIYSTTAGDLPAAAQTLPSGSTLAAFLDIDMGAAKYFSETLQVKLNVISGGANVGDTVAIYYFNDATNTWEPGDVVTVSSDGTVTFTVRHLSIWAAFKTATPPPGKPKSTSVTPGDAQVSVTWAPPATGSSPTSYNVYYKTTPGVTAANGTKVENAVSPQVISGLTNGITYYFVVTAVSANGESGPSSEEMATPSASLQPPASPNGLAVTAGAGKVTVQWNTKETASTYNIYYIDSGSISSTDLKATGTKVTVAAAADPQPTTQTHEISGLTAGITYSFIVTAENAAGESEAQTTPKKATPTP